MFNEFSNFVKIECCNCGVLWGVSSELDANWRKTKATFYCPNGHGQSYTKSTADFLKEQLAKVTGDLEKKREQCNWQSVEIEELTKKVAKASKKRSGKKEAKKTKG